MRAEEKEFLFQYTGGVIEKQLTGRNLYRFFAKQQNKNGSARETRGTGILKG